MIGSKLATNLLPLTSHGGRFAKGQPRVIVMHSIECPIQRGRALSIARYLNTVGLSVHYLVDPGAIVQGLDETLIGWGAGTVNSAAIHIEQAGYARYSRKQWTTKDGLAEIQRAGELVADITKRNNIPLRWLTDAQLWAAYRGTGPGGVTTHAQCTRVIGGTTHGDPGTGYPKDLLLNYAQGDDMELSDTDIDKIANAVWAKRITAHSNYGPGRDGTKQTSFTANASTVIDFLYRHASYASGWATRMRANSEKK